MGGIKDGLYLIYVKDGVVYPVALTTEQTEMFDILVTMIPGTIAVAFGYPMGQATNVIDDLKAKKGR